ncbi:SPW repeat protein [Microbacterium sp. p3-SID336]|uniref:SPW repeat domain-containing protein n=1 Tax=Microbacterium sp. p3-SID336 TaxID=2916212 RepID=UPI0021A7CE2F|nr:SPW repeat protein [Microbacterium sp. p3-SID336]MCT1476426.1 SPW repeat protein [Microbacterium sp. p3-SID336]
MRFIPTKVHGVLDYVVGVALIAAPWLFGFAGMGGAAVIIPIVLGVGLIVYSLFTKYEWGPFGVIPMPVHLVFDIVASLFLALSPWIFGFANQAPNVWLPHVIVGAAVIVVVLFSQPQPQESRSSVRAA